MSETSPPTPAAPAPEEEPAARRIVSEDLPLSLATGVATAVMMSILDVGAAWALAGVVLSTFLADAIKTELRSRGLSKKRLGLLTVLLLLFDRVRSAFAAGPRKPRPPKQPARATAAHWELVPVTALLASALVVGAFTVADVARGSALIGGGTTSFFGGGHGSSTGTLAATSSTGTTTTAATDTVVTTTSTGTTPTTGTTTGAPPPVTQLLTVVFSGAGTVVSNPPGIDCRGTCSARFPVGSEVTLSATPGAGGYRFAGWRGGGCSGTGTCRVRAGDIVTLTAVFVPLVQGRDVLEVVFEDDGEGRVVSRPAGIDCQKTCEAPFEAGQVVTLVAAPGVGSTFDGWKGCTARAAACAVTVRGRTSVAAHFNVAPGVSKLGVTVTSGGRVTSNPPGIDCPETCTAAFPTGSKVTLNASAEQGGAFSGWAGVDCTKPTCAFTLDGYLSVTADFEGPR